MAQTIAPIGSTIPAYQIKPGYILDLGDDVRDAHAHQFPVERVERYHDGRIRIDEYPASMAPSMWWIYLYPAEQVRIVGYFNPENA